MSDSPEVPEAVREHLALALVPGLGPRLTAALLERFGSAAAARRVTAMQLLDVPHIGEQTAGKIVAAMRTVNIEPELQLMAKHGARAVPLGFPGYPSPLSRVPGPPPLLYFRGEWVEADANAVGIVGSRNCTPYGRRVAAQLSRELARAGFTIVSGLARGIDGAAHEAAIEVGGRTIACLAGGLSRIYPPEHTDLAAEIANGRGCLVSEATMAMEPQPGMFPARNRIISALSRAVIVVEAGEKSGALHTARHAADQGREVFAVPGPVDRGESAGCLELIRKGARLVRSADDVIEDLKGIATDAPVGRAVPDEATARGGFATSGTARPTEPPAPLPPLSPEEQRLYDALAEKRHADELSRELAMPVADLMRALFQLEMKKIVRKLPGNYYERR
jgi:DNA processing protein